MKEHMGINKYYAILLLKIKAMIAISVICIYGKRLQAAYVLEQLDGA